MAPEITVVVPSHRRSLRLRWLLNALEEQTLARGRWEVLVVHEREPHVAALLAAHPLAADGSLRHLLLEPGQGTPARQRNAGWRAARAPLIAFTDDDCRPPAEWLERALAAATHHPGAVVQGATRPDPDEQALMCATRARTQTIDPPVPWAQTCNILYPRALLERLGGFDERLFAPYGEDTELAWRAIEAEAGYVGAPEVLTYHAVTVQSLAQRLRWCRVMVDVAFVVRRHPGLRRHYRCGLFTRPRHAGVPGLLAGGSLARRHPVLALLALPWLRDALNAHQPTLRGRARSLSELPTRALVDIFETAAVARGAVRHRTFVL